MGKTKTRQRKPPLKYLLGGAIFTMLVSFTVLGRVLSNFTTVVGYQCQDMLTMQHGATAYEDGIFDVLFLIVFALGGMVIAATVVGWARRDFTKSDIVLGAINGLMVLGLVLFCAIPWAFNNPTAPFAKEVNGLTRTFAGALDYESPGDFPIYSYRRSSNWTETETRVWRSEKLGLIVKDEVVWTCFSEGFIQENKAARYPSYDGKIPNYRTRLGYAYYTLEGEYLSAGHYGAWRDEPRFVPYYFLTKDRQGDAKAIAFLSNALRDDWQLYVEEYRAAEPQPALYTREEIDALVQKSWDDQN